MEKSCMSYNWEMFSKTLEVRALGMIGDSRSCPQSRCIVGVWNRGTLDSVTLCSRHFPCTVSDTGPNLCLLNTRNSPRYPGSQWKVKIALTSGIRNPQLEVYRSPQVEWRLEISYEPPLERRDFGGQEPINAMKSASILLANYFVGLMLSGGCD